MPPPRADAPRTPPGGPAADPNAPSLKAAAQADATATADRLLAVFRDRPPAQWRPLIAASVEWPKLRDNVLARADAVADAETDPAARAAARRLARKLRDVADELAAYDATLAAFIRTPAEEWPPLVAAKRGDLPAAFFEHAAARVAGLPREVAAARQTLADTTTRLAALVAAFDGVTPEAAAEAGARFDDLLQSDSLAAVEQKIDALAAQGKLDPALLLTMSKAYAAAKESDYTRDDAKEVMVHLWKRAQQSFAAQAPAEMRILKHILTLQGDVDVRSALTQAFQEAPPVETEDTVWLSTTPPKLMATMDAVLRAYDNAARRAASPAARAVVAQLPPDTVAKVRRVRAMVDKEFM